MELAASSAYDTGWLSSFSYTLLLIGHLTLVFLFRVCGHYLLFSLQTFGYLKAHATPKIPTTPAAAAVAAGPYLGCYGSHAEDIGMGLWQLFWLMLVAGSHSCSV